MTVLFAFSSVEKQTIFCVFHLTWKLCPTLSYFLLFFNFKALLGRRNDKPKDRYSRLDKEIENSNQAFIMDQQQQQEVILNFKAWFSLGHKHKHKDRRRRRKPEFSIPAHLDVKQDGGQHG